MNTFTTIFLITLFFSSFVQFWLSKRQADHVAHHRSAVPSAFKAKVTLAAHQKAADYTLDKVKLSNIDGVICFGSFKDPFLKEVVLALKYQKLSAMTPEVSDLLLKAFRKSKALKSKFDYLAAVPISQKRKAWRAKEARY